MIFYTPELIIFDFRDQVESIIEQIDSLYNEHAPEWQKKIFTEIKRYHQHNQFEIATSGTTGVPKIIHTSKERMRFSANATGDFFQLDPGDTALLAMNPKFIGGRMMIVRAIERNLKLFCVPPRTNPLLDLEVTIDFAALVPMQVEQVFRESPQQIKHLRNLIIGGGVTNEELTKKLCNSKINSYSTFGMTETLSHIALRKLSPQTEQVFTPLNHVTLEKDTKSCLTIRSEKLGIKELITNDLVEFIRDGFTWKGRLDDMINSGGIKIYPIEIEYKLGYLFSQTFIASSIPDEKLGEKLILIVEGTIDNEKELLLKCKKSLPMYHNPKRIFTLPEFPQTLTGKYKREDIRALLIQHLSS